MKENIDFLRNLTDAEREDLERQLNEFVNWYENFYDEDEECLADYSTDIERLYHTITTLQEKEMNS